jgi:hypothetical protein
MDVAIWLHDTAGIRDSLGDGAFPQNRRMEEAYLVCQHRNNDAAFRRFFGPTYPGVGQIVRFMLRHRVTTGIIVLMNVVGLLAYLVGF